MIVRYNTIYKIDICLNKQKKATFNEPVIYNEILFRKYTKRIKFKRMIHNLKEDDVIVVTSLEMLGNTTSDLLNKLTCIINKRIIVQIENSKLNTKNKISFGQFIHCICEAGKNKNEQLILEQKNIDEFQACFGSRKIMDINYVKLKEDLLEYLDGNMSINAISEKYNVSKSYLYKFVKRLK